MTTQPLRVQGREHYVALGLGRFRYLTWGDPSNPPLVLLHGRTSLVETWEEVAPQLSDRWHVIALEQRGHGGTAWDANGNYNLSAFVDDYEEFVRTVVGGKHVLIGHSNGSCAALIYASRNPETVVATVLEDGGPPGPTVIEAVSKDLAGQPDHFETWQHARDYLSQSYSHLNDDQLDRWTDLTVRPGDAGRYYFRSDVKNLLSRGHITDDLMDDGQWEAVPKIAMPTIFLWATAPHLVEPEVVEKMTEMNPLIQRITFPTGHSIHNERLDLFLESVVPFIEKHRERLSAEQDRSTSATS